ncbi:acyl-CoA dehydrogenase [Polycladidibacter stylochi]|uniref:acyl-CoA dehydrogenase n=1 Tax=Polycladidibacter stylochi TaxID=1807766 RepID=UPI00082A5469|nr:acyl-CoA dehydrogenase [Pseudovibrio stylochi]
MYRAPLSEIAFILQNTVDFSALQSNWPNEDLSSDLVEAILEEAAKFAQDVIAPLNKVGDQNPSSLQGDSVITPPGWAQAYKQWCASGWGSLAGQPDYGGQGLPNLLATALMEMWNSASMAFALAPTLTIGAIEALQEHGSAYLKQTYLQKLVEGQWTGTMNLTEPQAGSDLAALRCKAEPKGDGTYSIKGQKIFITYGDHDMSENIVHLVLARLPDAPPGTRGISLFLVPKFLVNDDGSLASKNDIKVAGLEHKMGIHASPTATMVYGENEGAIGWLIGEENKGLACMFTMMNNARLAVGIQGVGIAERAWQAAKQFALERKQGKSASWQGQGMSPIAYHPDIRRSLVLMRSKIQGARAICYACAHALDMSKSVKDDKQQRFWSERANLLTPIAKAYATDMGVEVASEALQIHGGMGYIEETGVAQHLRDARIAPIYEGTNAIQSIDLVMRKLPLSDGAALQSLLDEIEQTCDQLIKHNIPAFGLAAVRLKQALGHLEASADWIKTAKQEGQNERVLAGATPFLRLLAITLSAHLLAQTALKSVALNVPQKDQRANHLRIFSESVLPEVGALATTVQTASGAILMLDPSDLV